MHTDIFFLNSSQIPKFMKEKKLFWIDDDKKNMRQGNWSRPITSPGFFIKKKLNG